MADTKNETATRNETPPAPRVTINNSRVVPVIAGVSLLEALARERIFVPTACGGRGLCGRCRVKVLTPLGPFTPAELRHLSDTERASGVRLSCQIEVRGDLAIELPEDLLAVREYRGRVERISDLTHDIKLVRIRLIDPDEIRFAPGQYIQLAVPESQDSQQRDCPDFPVYRAFSIASPPSERRAIELIIRLVPGGLCTAWVFNALKEGDEVRFTGLHGEFGLSRSARAMFWIAGGSGMAPFSSIARDMARRNDPRHCSFFFGAVSRKDLFLIDEFREIEKKLPNFRFIPALSNPAPEDAWDGETGLITEVADRHVPQGTDAEAYLCGSAGMIEASIKVLRAKGIAEDRTFYDKFT